MQTFLSSRAITARDAVRDVLRRNEAALASGGGSCLSFVGRANPRTRADTTLATPVCCNCVAQTFAELLYAYRVSIPAEDLPAAVTSRGDCWCVPRHVMQSCVSRQSWCGVASLLSLWRVISCIVLCFVSLGVAAAQPSLTHTFSLSLTRSLTSRTLVHSHSPPPSVSLCAYLFLPLSCFLLAALTHSRTLSLSLRWGFECRTQSHNPSHAARMNHVCACTRS